MRKMLFGLVAAAALVVPATALAVEEPATTEGPSPAQACKQERQTIGADAFKALHGTNKTKANAHGKCVSKKAREQSENHSEAMAACRAEQADAAFADSHDGKAFDQYYGMGKGRNAFGKCVSSKAKAANQADHQAAIKAAKSCKAERKADPAAFKAAHGGKASAFGKCVSKKAKTKGAKP